MFRFFQQTAYRRYRYSAAVVCLLLLASSLLLHQLNWALVHDAAVTATKNQLLVLARAGTTSIETMLSMYKVELAILAEMPAITNLNVPEARKAMSAMVATRGLPIAKQIGLVNKDGILLVIATTSGSTEGEGILLADRSYFLWAKTAPKGAVFLSEPIIARAGINKGKWVVILATPLRGPSDNFNGVLYFSIKLEDIRTYYVDNLKIRPPLAVYLVDKDGLAVSTPFTSLTGINVRSYAQERKWPGYETYLTMIDTMTKGVEGNAIYSFMGSDNQIVRWINGFSPATVDGNTIIVAVATPYNSADDLVQSFNQNQIIWLVFIIITVVVLIFLFAAGLYIVKREGYNLGLKECYKTFKKK